MYNWPLQTPLIFCLLSSALFLHFTSSSNEKCWRSWNSKVPETRTQTSPGSATRADTDEFEGPRVGHGRPALLMSQALGMPHAACRPTCRNPLLAKHRFTRRSSSRSGFTIRGMLFSCVFYMRKINRWQQRADDNALFLIPDMPLFTKCKPLRRSHQSRCARLDLVAKHAGGVDRPTHCRILSITDRCILHEQIRRRSKTPEERSFSIKTVAVSQRCQVNLQSSKFWILTGLTISFSVFTISPRHGGMAASSSSDGVPIVLVTGASGFIGSSLVKRLLEDGHYRVRGTVRNASDEVKTQPLRQLVPDAKYPLELVTADLGKDEGWKEWVFVGKLKMDIRGDQRWGQGWMGGESPPPPPFKNWHWSHVGGFPTVYSTSTWHVHLNTRLLFRCQKCS